MQGGSLYSRLTTLSLLDITCVTRIHLVLVLVGEVFINESNKVQSLGLTTPSKENISGYLELLNWHKLPIKSVN